MKTAILITTILTLGILTIPSASASDQPVVAVNCNPYGPDGALVEVTKCVAREGGKNTGNACRLIFGENCDLDAEQFF